FKVPEQWSIDLAPQSFRLFVVRRDPGLLWTASAANVRSSPGKLDLTVKGPASVAGFLDLAAPPPLTVTIDGRPMRKLESAEDTRSGFWYDTTAGVLHLKYGHRLPHRIQVQY